MYVKSMTKRLIGKYLSYQEFNVSVARNTATFARNTAIFARNTATCCGKGL